MFIRKLFRYRFSNYSLALILINVAVYGFTTTVPQWTVFLALNPVYCIRGRLYWQVFTYMFVHGSLQHLLFNMLGLFFFGTHVERSIGSREFLLFYLLSGILCGILSLGIYVFLGTPRVFLVGASGAIYALLFAYAVIFPRSRIFVWGLLPVPAPLLVLAYGGISLAEQFAGRRTGVAHLTHFSGFLVAALYFRIRMGVKPLKVWFDAFR
ncbi:MAG: rhomboid family intramembrane serine protease [Spirochaetaceae bacterium]|jgi:membrane associated rhomboid family serine protease|nr:rhomboid family intramembrane serine protease [Spirochaetaceae bacterium]